MVLSRTIHEKPDDTYYDSEHRMILPEREHGGDLDRAIARHGGQRGDWLDLSTGINPTSFPIPPIPHSAWTDLPDQAAFDALERAARAFWNLPEDAAVVVASGASALIAAMPSLAARGPVHIQGPTYNEHAAAFRLAGFEVGDDPHPSAGCRTRIVVHPNNPDGKLHAMRPQPDLLTIVDESFCDVAEASHVHHADAPGFIVLKSFGKFWGLAGLRLGFAICAHENAARLRAHLGPWAASGPALTIGTAALSDTQWAEQTRDRLATMSGHLDRVMRMSGAQVVGGTALFRLYTVADGLALQSQLAHHKIWSRVFEQHPQWIRLGLPASSTGLERIARALA